MDCPYPDRHPDRCNIAHERMALERKCLRRAIRELKTDGWIVTHVHNGEERIATRTEKEILSEIFSVDESTVQVRHESFPRRSWFLVVLGNGIDCIPDYGTNIDTPMTRAYDYFETLA